MKALVFLASLAFLLDIVQTVPVADEDDLKTAFDQIADSQYFNPFELTVSGSFSVQEQIAYEDLFTRTIEFKDDETSRTLTSFVNSGPLFKLGGTNVELIIQSVRFDDSTGQGLFSLTGNKLTINSGTFTRNAVSVNALFATTLTEVVIGSDDTPSFNAPRALDINQGTLNILSGSFIGYDDQNPLIATFNTRVSIGGEYEPTFNAPRVFDVTQGTFNFIQGSFIGSGSKRTQIKVTKAEDVVFGNDMPLLFQNLNFASHSSAIVIGDCKNVSVNLVRFFKIQSENAASSTTDVYLTPVLVVYATTRTQLSITESSFANNTYSGRGAMSGAVFIDFVNFPAATDGFITFRNTQFTDNTGNVAGAIAFRGKSTIPITFSNVQFTRNRFTGQQFYSQKRASGVFTFEDLSSQLDPNPFRSCYDTHQIDISRYARDEQYSNQIPFYLSQKGNNQLPYLTSNKIAQVSSIVSGENTYATFALALSSFAGQGGEIVVLGSTYDLNDSTDISNFKELIIRSSETKPTIYNIIPWVDQQSYSFHVITDARLTMNSFKIVQGNRDGNLNDRTAQFFFIETRGFLSLTDVDFTTNLNTNIGSSGFVYVDVGYLIVDRCTFSKSYFASTDTAVRIASPRQVVIKNSNFTDNKLSYTSAGVIAITDIPVNTISIQVIDNIFSQNGPIPDQTSINTAGCLYIKISEPATLPTIIPIIDLQRNQFINNQGRSSGAISISGWGTGFPDFLPSNLLLDGSSFVGNKYLSTDPLLYSMRHDISSSSSNTIMSSLFGINQKYYHPSIVTGNPDDLDGTQPIVLENTGANPEPLKFRSFEAQLTFAMRFANYPQSPITLTGIHNMNGYLNITNVNTIVQGKLHDSDPKDQQAQLRSDSNFNPIIVSSTNAPTIRWLNFERSEESRAECLINVSSGYLDNIAGGINIDGCEFNDKSFHSDYLPEFSYIKALGRSIIMSISNCVFNGGKFGKGGAIQQTYALTTGVQVSSTLKVEKCVFNGQLGQTGPFIRSSENGQNQITTSIFRDAQFYSGNDINHAMLIFQKGQVFLNIIRANTFANFTNGPAISVESGAEDQFYIASNIFKNSDAGTEASGAIRIINPAESVTYTIQHNVFENNTGSTAGAIFIDATERSPRYNINNNLFSLNKADDPVSNNKANDIFILRGNTQYVRNNIQRGGLSYDALQLIENDELVPIEAYIVEGYYPQRDEVHVRVGGIDTSSNPDDPDAQIGSFESPLKTLDYAVNARSNKGDLSVVLYRQDYSITNTIYILDDQISIGDSSECQSPFFITEASRIITVLPLANQPRSVYLISSGSLILNGVITNGQSSVSGDSSPERFSIVTITEFGSFEANKASFNIIGSFVSFIESAQAIKSIKIKNGCKVTFPTYINYASVILMNITVGSQSVFEVSDTVFDARTTSTMLQHTRLGTITVENKPDVLKFKDVELYTTGRDTIQAKIIQFVGAEINPNEVFDHCIALNSSSPLLQFPGESYPGQYDNILLKNDWKSKIGQFSSLDSLTSGNPISVNNKRTYIGARNVFQINSDARVSVVYGGHLTIGGISFIQKAQGVSVIQCGVVTGVIKLEDVGFLVASRRLFKSGIESIASSKIREDFYKLKEKNDKIDYEYYLKSLSKTSSSQMLINPFVSVTNGYSISLSNIKFGQWIVSSEQALVNISGPVQYATIENVDIKKIGRKFGGPQILNLNVRVNGEVKMNNVTIDGKGWVPVRDLRDGFKDKNEYINIVCEEEKRICEREIDKAIQNVDELIDNTLDVQIRDQFKWKYAAIKIKGGKLRIDNCTFMGLGVDGAIVLEDVDADVTNSTRFEYNDVLSGAESEGRKKNIASEYKELEDEDEQDEEYDENDRRIGELLRYGGYVKNIMR